MIYDLLIRNGLVVNRNAIREADVLVSGGRIVRISSAIDAHARREIDAKGCWILPGIIDDQVHFREPGLTHKATIATESRAAVMGGVTAYMEMPNVNPPAVTQERLAAKYDIAAHTSPANYSFYMGTTNDNYDEVMRTDPQNVCGIKIFMGSSTGDMLVDEPTTLERLFANSPMLIATHCEDEATVRRNMADFQARFGEALHARHHPDIRSVEACLKSSSLAVEMARKHNTRLHVLHITTADELALFSNDRPLAEKRITAEVCVHHLFFSAADYETLGNRIKCNPAIKSAAHRDALLPALLDNRIDVVATDHAPHTLAEKNQPYAQAPSGLPLIQHTLNLMLEFYQQGKITIERIVEKMCHAPAVAFRIAERGFLDEGYWADLCIVDPNAGWTVSAENLAYKCGWSPLEGHRFQGQVRSTVVSGHLVWHEGKLDDSKMGERLLFNN
ncbi:MAG: dihydroorotase [Saprospiraceae bacterium]|nr:dihydroorotase [Saprospiraceae bacterium]